jgi:hypothetical protein
LADGSDSGSIDEVDGSSMIVVTRIPRHRNDGSEISEAELTRILNRVCDKFFGYSWEGPCHGAWVSTDGAVYREESYKLEVVVPPERVKQARAHFARIGKQLGQKAIYIEVREGGEIIDLE